MTALALIPEPLRAFAVRRGAEFAGICLVGGAISIVLALLSWSVEDPSLNHATSGPVRNLLGSRGAVAADLIMQMLGLGAIGALVPLGFWGWRLIAQRRLERVRTRLILWIAGGVLAAGLASFLPVTAKPILRPKFMIRGLYSLSMQDQQKGAQKTLFVPMNPVRGNRVHRVESMNR